MKRSFKKRKQKQKSLTKKQQITFCNYLKSICKNCKKNKKTLCLCKPVKVRKKSIKNKRNIKK